MSFEIITDCRWPEEEEEEEEEEQEQEAEKDELMIEGEIIVLDP